MAEISIMDNLVGRPTVVSSKEFTIYRTDEIYNPADPKEGKYIPNPDDLVVDIVHGMFVVESVDYTTGLTTLKLWEPADRTESIDEEVVLTGGAPSHGSQSWRVYLDRRKMPYVMAVDRRIIIDGSDPAYIKVFKGVDTTASGTVVSMVLDANNQPVSENVPLDIVQQSASGVTRTAKVPRTFRTTHNLQDREVVTVVVYSATGVVLETFRLIVQTSAARLLDAQLRRVTSVELVSPFMSPTDLTLIEVPINVDMRTIPLTARVNYSDGDTDEYAVGVDTGKVTVAGIDRFIPTIPGQENAITLLYTLGDNEHSLLPNVTPNGKVPAQYRIRTVAARNAYNVKLYAYPVWKNEVEGYTLDYWMYNMERDVYYRVPRHQVEVTPPLDGLDFSRIQRLNLSVNMNQVDPRFTSYRHVQLVDIHLRNSGGDASTNWTVGLSAGSSIVYGEGLHAYVDMVDGVHWELDLANGITEFQTWLRKLYYNTHPITDPMMEPKAPEPTHVAVHYGQSVREFAIDAWDTPLLSDVQYVNGTNVYLRWIKRTLTNDIELGVSGLTVRQR